MDETPETPKASFAGRLNISDYALAETPRRSPRLTTSNSTTSSPGPAPTRSPLKRKASPSPTPSRPRSTPTRPKPRSPRKPTGYAPPSTYAHLPGLTDSLGPSLLVLFVGLNPGLTTAQTGHAYSHPSNSFWKLLFSSGVTPRLVSPREDKGMPGEYALGLTNIVKRPSRNASELSKGEMDGGVGALEEKARACRAEVVCFVGKSIWESVWRVRKGKGMAKAEFKYGWQDERENFAAVEEGEERWGGARVFVASSTSGLAATLSPAEKEAIWRELGVYVKRRRAERAAETEAASGDEVGSGAPAAGSEAEATCTL